VWRNIFLIFENLVIHLRIEHIPERITLNFKLGNRMLLLHDLALSLLKLGQPLRQLLLHAFNLVIFAIQSDVHVCQLLARRLIRIEQV